MTTRRRKNFDKRTIAERYLFAGGRCESCGVAVKAGQYHADHDIPTKMGGPATFENCRILCVPCHDKKTREDDIPEIARAVRREAINTGADRVAKRARGQGFKRPPKPPRETSKTDQLRALRERKWT